MSSFGIKLAKNLRLLSSINSVVRTNTIQRTYYAPSALGIDGFKRQQESFELSTVNTVEPFKKRIAEALNEDKAIFTEDLKTLLHLVRNDTDLELLVKLLKRYKTQSLVVRDYSFGSPIIRLLYVMNKTDEALKLFTDPEMSHVFSDKTSVLILVNKLLEDKRPKDAVKLFFNLLNNGKRLVDRESDPKKYSIPGDLIKLVTEALYQINNKEALEHTKSVVKLINEFDNRLPINAIINIVLLAINQNEFEFAYEALGLYKGIPSPIIRNLKATLLSHMGRFQEALEMATSILESTDSRGNPGLIFPLMIKTLREKTLTAEEKQKVEELSKKIVALNRLSPKDFSDIVTQIVAVRVGPANQQRDSNFNNNGQYPHQYQNNQEGGFNRQPRQYQNNQEDGQSGGFNRQPRQYQNNQEGGQSGGFNRQPRQYQNNQEGGFNRQPRQFEQGEQQIGSRFNRQSDQQSRPPRRQENDE